MVWGMNEQEVRALINKVIDADKVVHVQQLGIAWTPPTNPIFSDNVKANSSGWERSQVNPNTSVADSSRHGQSKMEGTEDRPGEQSQATNIFESQVSITKIKKIFHLIIDEMPFLIDQSIVEQCENKSEKAAFKIKIDAIRKALDIENMDDVEMLVTTFYEWSRFKKAEKERLMAMNEGEEEEEEIDPMVNDENEEEKEEA